MAVTRVYEYLMAGIALLAAAVGLAMVVVALVESMVPATAVEVGTSVVNSLLSGVTLLLVGGPLWLVFWSRIERATRDGGPEELGSPTRRIYLFLLFGLGGVAAVIAVLVAAFLGIQKALQNGFDAQVVREMRIPVAILLATGAISGYHWVVYRHDRSQVPVTAPQHAPRYVLLVGAPDCLVVTGPGRWPRLRGRRTPARRTPPASTRRRAGRGPRGPRPRRRPRCRGRRTGRTRGRGTRRPCPAGRSCRPRSSHPVRPGRARLHR